MFKAIIAHFSGKCKQICALHVLGVVRDCAAQLASISEGGGPLAVEGAVSYLRLARSFVVSDCAAGLIYPNLTVGFGFHYAEGERE